VFVISKAEAERIVSKVSKAADSKSRENSKAAKVRKRGGEESSKKEFVVKAKE